MVLDEWSVFAVKARDDCRILWRSFSPVQHIAPLKYLQYHPENVTAALLKYPDRVAMYNSTHVATIPKNISFVPRVEYAPRATFGDDMRVLYSNFLHRISGESHKDRLESFYKGQARVYDSFRHRFLHGRVPMVEAMPTPKNGVWVDLGGGTGANMEVRSGLSRGAPPPLPPPTHAHAFCAPSPLSAPAALWREHPRLLQDLCPRPHAVVAGDCATPY